MSASTKSLKRFFSKDQAAARVRRFRERRRVVKQCKGGRSLRHGFLHIPKTGGSAFSDFVRGLEAQGITMPVKFSHYWRLEDILEKFPNTQVSFMIRDPLERTVSAFNSRLRQGRPRNHSMWTHEEAVSFSMFPSAQSLLDGMISDDEYQISAVKYALGNIKHLRRNYRHYFGGVVALGKQTSQIHLVGEVNESSNFWIKLAAEFDIPEEIVIANYKKAHVSKFDSDRLYQRYSEEQLERIKQILKSEYRVYGALKKMVNC